MKVRLRELSAVGLPLAALAVVLLLPGRAKAG
jgi:hypothetical protein